MIKHLALIPVIAISALIAPAPVGTEGEALAGCPDVGKTYVKYKLGDKTYIGTNVYSAYITGPGRINYSESVSATANASVSKEIGAEIDGVIASMKGSYGISTGKSYTKQREWTYSIEVGKGKTLRAHLLKEAIRVKVTKKRVVPPCNTKTVYSEWATLPLKNNNYMWVLVGENE